jgi:hypothetical protein
LQHAAESLERERLGDLVVSTAGARPFLVGLALDAGDIEQGDAWEAPVKLPEQPGEIGFCNPLIVQMTRRTLGWANTSALASRKAAWCTTFHGRSTTLPISSANAGSSGEQQQD